MSFQQRRQNKLVCLSFTHVRAESRGLILGTGQGIAVAQGYQSVPYDKFFKVTFQPASSFGTHCTALFRNPPDYSVCGNNNLKQTLFKVANVILANFAYQVVKDKPPFYFIHGAGSQKGTKRSEDVILETLPVETDG